MNILSNEKADQAAKKGTELQKTYSKYASLSYIKKRIKESVLLKQQQEYANINKGKFYSQFECFPRWRTYKKTVKKKIWSAFIQLKLGHGYFKSYLVRLPDYTTNKYFICDIKKNSKYLILYYKVT